MTKSLIKNTFREIKNTKARFISIMAIIALGVGFFAGIKATVPSMYNLARTYTDEQELMDYRLVSTVGFDEDDIKAVKNTDGVTSVMPSYFCDVQTDADSGGRTMRVIALPEKYGDNYVQNNLVLTEGRLPEKSGEIAPIQPRSRQRVIKSATKSDLQNRRAIQILQPNLKPLNTRWSVLCSHLFT